MKRTHIKNEYKRLALSEIKTDTDRENVIYTNESIFECIKNRVGGIVPDGIEYPTNFGFGNSSGTGNNLLPVGTYIPPIGSFNIVAAIQKAASMALKSSSGSCAKYVRIYLEAGGINLSGHPVSAYKYAAFLPTKGFKLIETLSDKASQSQFTASRAKPGDVAVMAHGPHGHICMFTGRQWVSDFVQNNIWVYGGNGTVQIFRYTI